jgi:hypothetical protein
VASEIPLELFENDDTEVNVPDLTTNKPTDGTPLNLTGMTVEVTLKVSASTPDGDAGSWQATSVSDPGAVLITDAANGKVQITFPHAKVTTAMGWWRLTIINGSGLRKTAVYGPVTVVDT